MGATDTISVLIVSKGHAYDHTAFLAMFENMPGIVPTLVEHPAAQMVLEPAHAAAWDAVLFYDMSGIPGAGLTHDRADSNGQPSPAYAAAVQGLLDRGVGLVLLNHATVSWPNWPLWRRITGSSFMLKAGELNGVQVPGSGYRGGHGPFPNAVFQVRPDGAHPVLEGLGEGFEISDELYLKTREFESRVTPLLRADYDFVDANFSPPPLAPADEQAQWRHPPGSNLVVWAHAVGASPVVVSEIGDGPVAFGNPAYRRMIENALRWSASAAGRAWAAARR